MYGNLVDTLALARDAFPGKRNNLEALCERFGVPNAHRTLHGALLDAQLLAEVYASPRTGVAHHRHGRGADAQIPRPPGGALMDRIALVAVSLPTPRKRRTRRTSNAGPRFARTLRIGCQHDAGLNWSWAGSSVMAL
jgi:DNA polymerase III epsilon subunit-like protein